MNLCTSKMTPAEIVFAISDLREVIVAQEEMDRAGLSCPKLGAYWDDLYACLAASSSLPKPPALPRDISATATTTVRPGKLVA